MGSCRLCLKEKELCKKSHIIPDFMYRELFDKKHRIVKGNPVTDNRPQDLHNGEYEGGILCLDCDNRIIGGYESYASKVLYGGKIPVSTNDIRRADDGLEITVVHGLDYKTFKLFLLSLLWRASISSRRFFAAVNLGPYEEKLREMLLLGNPGSASYVPCIMTSYKRTGIPGKVIVAPRKTRFADGRISYAFVISGMMYVFRVVEKENIDWVLEASVHENGDMQIPHAPRDSTARLFNKLLGADVF